MLFLPTCVLTAVLAAAVSATTATTMLPHLAYNGPGSIGQSVTGAHAPTTIAPTVMLPTWQGSELRLHKRAPTGMGTAAEEVNVEKRDMLKNTIFGSHGQYNPTGSISHDVALKAPPEPKELKKIRKDHKDDLHRVAFDEQRARVTHIYAPLRQMKIRASYLIRNLAGHVLKVFNKKKGNKMLDETSQDALEDALALEKGIHRSKIDQIHTTFKAKSPERYYGPGETVTNASVKEQYFPTL